MNEKNKEIFFSTFDISTKTFGCHTLTPNDLSFVEKAKMNFFNPAKFALSDALFKTCRFAIYFVCITYFLITGVHLLSVINPFLNNE